MTARTSWRRVPLREVDQELYGRTASFYRHPAGFSLVHHKHQSRGSKHYHSCGMWMLIREPGGQEEPELLLRKPYVAARRPPNKPPINWANQTLRRLYGVDDEDSRPLVDLISGSCPITHPLPKDYSSGPDPWRKQIAVEAELRRKMADSPGAEAQNAAQDAFREIVQKPVPNEHAVWLVNLYLKNG